MRPAFLALPLLVALRIAPAAAQRPADSTLVAGVVRAGGGVLVGAEVTLTPVDAENAPARRTFTSDDGQFRVGGLPPGRTRVAVRRIGFRPYAREIDVPAKEPVTIAMEALPQQLATVVVNDRRATYTGWAARFYERRDRGMGRYFTRLDIDRRNPTHTTDLLRTVPGLQLVASPYGMVPRLRNCRQPPFIWIDGSPATAGYLDVDAFTPSTLEGIEIYSGPASVPLELRGPRGEESCGVIALWSRVPEPRRKQKKAITAEELSALVASATVFTAEQVDRAAQPDSTRPLVPIYPDSLRREKVPGEAVVEFVVDANGEPEPETIGIVSATHPLFALAARNAVPGARWSPAVKDGRAVRQLVQAPVRFDVVTQPR